MTASNRRTRQTAFTLVELLVVIGIIAILVGVLLPSLVSARRSAQTIKCSSALSEIANAFKLYSIDNKGYYPPMRCVSNYQVLFGGNPPSVYTGGQSYWMYFLARYVTHGKIGASTGGNATNQDQATAMASVLWGCPNFVPIQSTTNNANNGIAMVYTGYGMNGFPEYTATYPKVSGDQYDALGDSLTSPNPNINAVSSVNSLDNWTTLSSGKWYKYSAYTRPAERALVGDCCAYVLEALKATSTATIQEQISLSALQQGIFWPTPITGASSYDYYRHGKYPSLSATANQLSKTGGKIGYNVMYADGHVVTLQTREEGFLAARMRFPG